MWNVCDFIGDIIRQLIGTELWCGGAPEQKGTLVPGVPTLLLPKDNYQRIAIYNGCFPTHFFPHYLGRKCF